MTHTRSTHAAADAAPQALPEREALIRTAAYFRYVNNGCRVGHDAEDWLAAEVEVEQWLACLRAGEAPVAPAAATAPVKSTSTKAPIKNAVKTAAQATAHSPANASAKATPKASSKATPKASEKPSKAAVARSSTR